MPLAGAIVLILFLVIVTGGFFLLLIAMALIAAALKWGVNKAIRGALRFVLWLWLFFRKKN